MEAELGVRHHMAVWCQQTSVMAPPLPEVSLRTLQRPLLLTRWIAAVIDRLAMLWGTGCDGDTFWELCVTVLLRNRGVQRPYQCALGWGAGVDANPALARWVSSPLAARSDSVFQEDFSSFPLKATLQHIKVGRLIYFHSESKSLHLTLGQINIQSVPRCFN